MQPFPYLSMAWPIGSGITPILPISPRKVITNNATQSLKVLLVARDINGKDMSPATPSLLVDISSEWATLVSSAAQVALEAILSIGNTQLATLGQDFTGATIITTPIFGLQMNWNLGAGISINALVVFRDVIINMDEQQFLVQLGPIDNSGNYIGGYTQIDIGQLLVPITVPVTPATTPPTTTTINVTAFQAFAGSQVVPVLTTIQGLGATLADEGGHPDFSTGVITQPS